MTFDKKKWCRKYYQTENGKKSTTICTWKWRGIICDDYDELYDWYKNTSECMNCGKELSSGSGLSNKRHLDHDHKTGEPYMVVCGYCNINILK